MVEVGELGRCGCGDRLHFAITSHADPWFRSQFRDSKELLCQSVDRQRLSLALYQGGESVHSFHDIRVDFPEMQVRLKSSDGVAVLDLGMGKVVNEVWRFGVFGVQLREDPDRLC